MAQPENGVPDGTHFMDTTAATDQGMEQKFDTVNSDMQDATNDAKHFVVAEEHCQGEDKVKSVGDGGENSTFSEDVQFISGGNIFEKSPEENKENGQLDGDEGLGDMKLQESNTENDAHTVITATDGNEMSDIKSIDAISLTDIKASFLNNQEMGDGDCKSVDKGNEIIEIVDSENHVENNLISNSTSIPPAVPVALESSDSSIKPGNSDSGSLTVGSNEFSVPNVDESNDMEKKVASNYAIQPGELTDKLIEGPSITLPLSEISNRNSSAAVGNKLCVTENKTSSISLDSEALDRADASFSAVSRTETTNSQEHPPSYTSNETTNSSKPGNTTTATTSSTPVTTASSAPAQKRMKKTPDDFIFGKVLGEGSYSSVYLAKEVSTQREFAVKVCEKKHLIREKKTHFVMREKEVLMKLDHPFFIKLAYTFQDAERLYYVLTYARNGELLGYLNKLSVFDVPCTRFYSAEVVIALEYLQSLGIVHRDMKPENILLGEDMHIKISDFGTSKFINGTSDEDKQRKKKNSFVGTAEYVTPEVLNGQPANYGTDLWAVACIIYQCLSSSLPFRSGNEYQTFQKILKLEYEFPEGFHEDAKDLVQRLLVLEPTERLGMKQPGGMEELKRHPFFQGIEWATLPTTTPPKLLPYLPATANNPEFWGEQEQRTGFDDQRLAEIITGQSERSTSPELEPVSVRGETESAEVEKLEKQRQENQFHQFVENNLILRQGFVDKRKGFFARKRMLLLTEGPHLYYVDAHNKVLKGEIPWSKELRTEAKNFKIFFVHTPNRTYYLESRSPDAHHWVKRIQEVWNKYYGNGDDQSSNKGL